MEHWEQRICWCIVEGAIGVGKTATIEAFKHLTSNEAGKILYVNDPVDTWTRPLVGTQSFLDAQYNNNSDFDKIAFQLSVLTRRCAALQVAFYRAHCWLKENPTATDVFVVSERSPIGDNAFANVSHDNNKWAKEMYTLAMESQMSVFNVIHKNIHPFIVMLEADVETITQRIQKRGWACDAPLVVNGQASEFLKENVKIHRWTDDNNLNLLPNPAYRFPNFDRNKVLIVDSNKLQPDNIAVNIKEFLFIS